MSGDDPVTDIGARLPLAGDGVHWTLHVSDDLNANLVHLDPGHEVGAHVNDSVDVLLVVFEGQGEVVVDGDRHALGPTAVAHVPCGARRSIHAGASGLTYLTVHRRRGGLAIGPPRRPASGM